VPPVRAINEALEKFHGKFMVATPQYEILNGNPLEVIVIMEFDTQGNAKAFYNSSDYRDYKMLHERTTNGWILLSPEYQKK
jgi:uncharacterized protein (DUF1330 family)